MRTSINNNLLPPPSGSDAKLVDSAREQLPYDTRAFVELVIRYNRKVHRTCQRMLSSAAEADDAAQEIFLSVFSGLPGFEARSSFSTWLFQITRYECLSRLRRRQREKEELTQLETNLAVQSGSDVHRSSDVDAMLSILSIADREILTLRFVSDLSHEEVAVTLGLSRSAAKMRLYRAIERLKGYVRND